MVPFVEIREGGQTTTLGMFFLSRILPPPPPRPAFFRESLGSQQIWEGREFPFTPAPTHA